MAVTTESTDFGFYVRGSGHLSVATAVAWSRDLMQQVRAEARPSFDLLIDLRGQEHYDGQIADIVRRTREFSHLHGVRRSAVISDDPTLLLRTRQTALSVPGSHASERYFNALHGSTWLEDAQTWLRTGAEPTGIRADEAATELLALLDAIAQPIALLDAEGRLLRSNSAMRRQIDGAADPLITVVVREARTYALATMSAREAMPESRNVALSSGERWKLEFGPGPRGILGAQRLILVTATHASAAQGRPLSDADLMTRFSITPRELEVARLVAGGASNPEIAQRLGTRRGTARNQVSSVLQKLGVQNRTALTAFLLRGGA